LNTLILKNLNKTAASTNPKGNGDLPLLVELVEVSGERLDHTFAVCPELQDLEVAEQVVVAPTIPREAEAWVSKFLEREAGGRRVFADGEVFAEWRYERYVVGAIVERSSYRPVHTCPCSTPHSEGVFR
jgi:hypothetical protein